MKTRIIFAFALLFAFAWVGPRLTALVTDDPGTRALLNNSGGLLSGFIFIVVLCWGPIGRGKHEDQGS
jgi:hypothetical protein